MIWKYIMNALILTLTHGRHFLIWREEGLISTGKDILLLWRQVTGFIPLCLKVASINTGVGDNRLVS